MGTSVEFNEGFISGEKLRLSVPAENLHETAEQLANLYKIASDLPVGDPLFAFHQGEWHGFNYHLPLSVTLANGGEEVIMGEPRSYYQIVLDRIPEMIEKDWMGRSTTEFVVATTLGQVADSYPDGLPIEWHREVMERGFATPDDFTFRALQAATYAVKEAQRAELSYV